MLERAPNGFFVRDMMIFNHLRRGGYVSKGFIFEAPDLTNSPSADLNDFQDQLCLLLASLHESQVEAVPVDDTEEKNSTTQKQTKAVRPNQRMKVSV